MRKEKIGLYSIRICLIGIFLALIAGYFVNHFRFIPEFKSEEFNYSIFLAILILFIFLSIITRLIFIKKQIELIEEETLENLKDNYKLKSIITSFESLSIYLIIFQISFVLWMLIYNPNNKYCYFLCSIKETIIMAILFSFFFSAFFIFIREVFLVKKSEYLKKK